MNILKSLWNKYQYSKLYRRFTSLPDNQQVLVGQRLYAEAYEVMKASRGDTIGTCSVVFSCPYEGHVAYHIERTLERRAEDPLDPTMYAQVIKLDADDKWLAIVVVKGRDENCAMTMADADAMSAILKATTVEASFTKYLSVVDAENAKSADKASLMKFLRQQVRDAAQPAVSALQ